MHDENFDALVLEELRRLADKRATSTELATCPELLSLLPASIALQTASNVQRARAFRQLLVGLFDTAYEFHLGSPEAEGFRITLAAGALMGFVTQGPGKEKLRPSDMSHASADLTYRRNVAGSWLLLPVQADTVRRATNMERYLSHFQHELYDHLDRFASVSDQTSAPLQVSVPEVLPEKQTPRPATESPAPKKLPKPPNLKGRPWKRRISYAVIASTVALVVIGGLLLKWQPWENGEDSTGTNDRIIDGGQSEENKVSGTAPIKVVSVSHQDTGQSIWAFEDSQEFNPSELEPINASSLTDETYTWFTSRGAVPVDRRRDRIAVEGNTSEPVEINDLQVDKQCRAPLSGTLFESPNAGQENNIRLGLDLDEQRPTAQSIEQDGNKPDYFARHSISLKKGERASIVIEAWTMKSYCEYTLNLKMTVGDETVTQIIKDDGKPFKLSARIEASEDAMLSGYQSAYVGGVLNANCGGGFRKVNAKTWTSLDQSC
ncbi:hypothetical protein GCM10010306_104940 [Streptomyces umbrinus]|uniref:hypothetical protein n=1 Tax=Streptomyces umbrinus TaxID=67370 RepID=UPI00167B5081|nr:hypothetical protein [Streptomyces umbrinus]GHB92939.1 hypothetical protein GCM10010306_104940 [Streptomyces umbrinus]